MKSWLTPEEERLKIMRDNKNVLDYAREEGYKEGLEAGRKEAANMNFNIVYIKNGIDNKVDLKIISDCLNLSMDEVNKIIKEQGWTTK